MGTEATGHSSRARLLTAVTLMNFIKNIKKIFSKVFLNYKVILDTFWSSPYNK